MLMIVGAVTGVIALVVIICRRLESFIAEFVISFTPQLAIVLIALVLLQYLLSGSAISSWQLFLLLINSVLVAVVIWPLLQFSLERSGPKASKANFRISAFNKLHGNDDNRAIARRINELKPDAVGLLEVKPADYAALKNQIRLPHHFMSKYQYGLGKLEFLLFSRHPILKVDIKPIDNYCAVVVADLKVNNKKLSLLLVHTTAPIVPPLLSERNKGLNNLTAVIKKRQSRLLVMGDFNLTPWSKTYRKFIAELSHIYNVSEGRGLHFTWRLIYPFVAHIDHIFASRDIATSRFVVDRHLGSDHKLIYADLSI